MAFNTFPPAPSRATAWGTGSMHLPVRTFLDIPICTWPVPQQEDSTCMFRALCPQILRRAGRGGGEQPRKGPAGAPVCGGAGGGSPTVPRLWRQCCRPCDARECECPCHSLGPCACAGSVHSFSACCCLLRFGRRKRPRQVRDRDRDWCVFCRLHVSRRCAILDWPCTVCYFFRSVSLTW